MRASFAVAVAIAALAATTGMACKGEPPPGAVRAEPSGKALVVTPEASGSDPASSSDAPAGKDILGTAADSLPFAPTEARIASIAWRTWVYTDTGANRTRYGYLRAGAIVPSRGPAIQNEGCTGGWYRVNPRGFVCVGHGATLELGHAVVVASDVRAKRGESLPYLYVMARDPGPHLYYRLPTPDEMQSIEGAGYAPRSIEWKAQVEREHLSELLNAAAEPPPFIPRGGSGSLTKPYGTEQGLHSAGQAGQSSPDAGFAIARAFDSGGRTFGLTTELDVIPLDRTKIVRPSEFHGVVLGEGEDLPAAIVTKRFALKYEELKPGVLKPVGTFGFREPVKLTGRKLSFEGVTFWEGQGGVFVPTSSALILEKRTSYPSVADGSRKWIDISIRDQSLIAYEGTKAAYVTLVSTGLAGMMDPEKTPSTVRGTFMIHTKHVSSTMDGDEDVSDSYSLRDVPFVQYFHKGYALHAAYWHDNFGKVRSHGCVNLAPIDAAWLFEWTDPAVPEGWHGVINKERGTAVVIHG